MSEPDRPSGPDDPGPSPEGSGEGSEASPGMVFWAAMAVGGAISAYGAYSFYSSNRNQVRSFATWLVGGALLLDLAIIPAAAVIAMGGRRVLPAWAWPPVRAALLATATLVAFAVPMLRGYGGGGNPTVQPRDYSTGLISALIVVWVAAGVALALVVVSARMRRTVTEPQ